MHSRRFLVIIAATLAACGGDDDGGGGGGGATPAVSCTHAGDSCAQLNGALTAEQSSQMSSLCAAAGGTFAAAACNTASTVPGSCSYGDGGFGIPGVTEVDYYYSASWNATTAPADCADLGGTWTGGSAGGNTGPTSGTCTISGVMCIAYSGSAAAIAAAQAECASDGATWGTSACSTTTYVGACAAPGLGMSLTYYPPVYDAAAARADCSSMSGTFTAGNTTGGNTGGTPQSFGCQPTGEPFCTDVSGTMTAETRAQYEAVCTSGGTVISGCPTASRTGTCTYVMAGVSFMDRFYVQSQAAEDQAICVAEGGTWTPN